MLEVRAGTGGDEVSTSRARAIHVDSFTALQFFLLLVICCISHIFHICHVLYFSYFLYLPYSFHFFQASIWAGDLISVYSKYAETEGWTVSPVSDTQVGLTLHCG